MCQNPVFMRAFKVFAYAEIPPRLSLKWFKNAQKALCILDRRPKNTPEDLGRVVDFLFFVSITLFVVIMSRISKAFNFL